MSNKSRKQMVEFLTSHFRYNTMNSWNNSTSYAANVKIHKFVPNNLMDKAYEMLDQEEVFYNINLIMRDFGIEHNYNFQAGFNGRSTGYIVLYCGERKLSEYKSVCTKCGQRNYQKATDKDDKCGVCKGKRVNREFYQVSAFSGRSIDQNEDFSEWDLSSIKERYELVKEFDKMVEQCKKEFIYYCKNFKVEEETIQVSKKIKVLKEK